MTDHTIETKTRLIIPTGRARAKAITYYKYLHGLWSWKARFFVELPSFFCFRSSSYPNSLVRSFQWSCFALLCSLPPNRQDYLLHTWCTFSLDDDTPWLGKDAFFLVLPSLEGIRHPSSSVSSSLFPSILFPHGDKPEIRTLQGFNQSAIGDRGSWVDPDVQSIIGLDWDHFLLLILLQGTQYIHACMYLPT